MKRTVFVLSLFALLLSGFSTAQAQNAIAPTVNNASYNGLPVVTAYRRNLQDAINNGNVQMAPAHQMKMSTFMERDIQALKAESAAAPDGAKKAAEIKRREDILADLKTWNLSTPNGLAAAKAKMNILDEYETLYMKNKPATN